MKGSNSSVVSDQGASPIQATESDARQATTREQEEVLASRTVADRSGGATEAAAADRKVDQAGDNAINGAAHAHAERRGSAAQCHPAGHVVVSCG